MSRTARDGCAVYPVKRKHLTKEACFLALLFRYPGALHWRNRWENGLPFGARKPSVKDRKNGALLSLMSFRQLSSSFLFFFFATTNCPKRWRFTDTCIVPYWFSAKLLRKCNFCKRCRSPLGISYKARLCLPRCERTHFPLKQSNMFSNASTEKYLSEARLSQRVNTHLNYRGYKMPVWFRSVTLLDEELYSLRTGFRSDSPIRTHTHAQEKPQFRKSGKLIMKQVCRYMWRICIIGANISRCVCRWWWEGASFHGAPKWINTLALSFKILRKENVKGFDTTLVLSSLHRCKVSVFDGGYERGNTKNKNGDIKRGLAVG